MKGKLFTLISFLMLVSMSCATVLLDANFESDAVGALPAGWANNASTGATMTASTGAMAPWHSSTKSAYIGITTPGVTYAWYYASLAANTAQDATVSYWVMYKTTAHTQQVFIAGGGGNLFSQQVDAAGGPGVYIAGPSWTLVTTCTIDTWYHVKYWIHAGSPGTVDFYWNNMSTPIRTGVSGYAGAAFNVPIDFFEVIAYNPMYLDDAVIETGLRFIPIELLDFKAD